MARKPWKPNYNYVEALREFLDPQPIKRRGRSKKLVKQELGQLLKAIAEINSKNRYFANPHVIAQRLKLQYADYQHLSERQLRRDVKAAIDWEVRILKRTPLARWEELLGIEPPENLTPNLLREKAFEYLRHELRRHQLMAKNT
jgi:hypothetical protein